MKGITLIGMPGSGKSTIGRQLAERLGLTFIDLDLYIKEQSGRGHDVILNAAGNSGLVDVEEKYALKLPLENTVFAPGGSIVYSPRAMERLGRETRIIYLEIPIKEIERRLGSGIENRGIVGFKEKGLRGVSKERRPLYESHAHYTIRFRNQSVPEIIEEIIRWL